MAQQDAVLNWLGGAYSPPGQLNLNLGKQIESFETDFANGYMFGQILTHYGVADSIDTFQKKSNKESKCHNFYQVEDGLRKLKVPFDAKLIHNIMNEEAGSSLKLLTLMKIAFDKHFSKSNKTVTNLKQSTLDTNVKQVADLALKLPEIHKQYGVAGPTFKATKLARIEEKLLKYEVARANLEKKAEVDDMAEKNMLSSIQQQKRQDAMEKLAENQQFMKDWEATGKKNWRQNRETRACEIQRQLYFDDREIKIYKDMLQKELTFNDTDMRDGVVEFQENLRKLGIEESIDIQEAIKRQEEKRGIPPGQIQNFSYAATMNKIKETKNTNEFAGKERDRRNRKMHVDQRKIQETLDQQKKEEMLMTKLLKRQTQEQQEAYTRWRNDQCKEIVTQNRIKKAERVVTDAYERNIDIQKKMKIEADAVEEERRIKHQEDQIIVKQFRLEEKLKKRRVNVEIASEIIDLIMDVTDEAYDYQLSHLESEEELLTKEIWREWMGVFSEGKRVSEINVVITKEESIDEQSKELDSLALLLGSGDKHITPYQILDKIQSEPIFIEFMQYLSMCGPLNLRLVAPDKWGIVQQLANQEQTLKDKSIDLGFLDELYIPKDIELGYLIESLYFGGRLNEEMRQSMYKTDTASGSIGGLGTTFQSSSKALKESPQHPNQTTTSKMDIILEEGSNQNASKKGEIPNWHMLKLCIIGKSYSGKQTQAKLIQKEYGDKITIFNMDEIIREAFGFVMQSNKAAAIKEEVPDPKAKGGAKAAAKVETTVELFVGQDTTFYKDIAASLLKQVQVTYGSEEIPGKDIDLISLVSDDQLFVNLFIEKLKLTFNTPPPNKDDVEKQMRENLVKKKDLVDQLDEAKANETSEPDLKAAAKGGKGGVKIQKSSKEIEDEIDHLMSVDINGWVLLDFPRTINQAKLLENLLTGYKSLTDAPKIFERSNFEVWSKFADPEYEYREKFQVDMQAQSSFFDGIFMMSTDKDECMRRAQNRKIDSTTGTVYHAEDNAPPEGDAKLSERLTGFFGKFQTEEDMITKIDHNHIQFQDQDSSLKKFYNEFGVIDQQTGKGNVSFHNVSVNGKIEKSEIFQQIINPIKCILIFKNIEKDREYQNLEAIIKAKEQADDVMEEAPSPDEKESVHDEKVDTPAEGMTKKSFSKQSFREESEKGGYGQTKMSKGSLGRSGSLIKVKKTQLSRGQKIHIWENMIKTYFKDGMLTLNDIKKQNETVTDCLNFCQAQFIQFLEREDTKQDGIDEFTKSFNQFATEFPDLRKDDQAKDELLTRVETLSNSLWQNIEMRKNQSIEEIQKQSEEGWSVQEMKNLVKNMANLIEIEIKKFSIIYQILLDQEPPVELDAEILVKKLLERGVQPYDAQSKQSTILNQVITSILSKMEDLFVETYKEQTITAEATQQILEQEKKIFIYKLTMINAWGLAILEEISNNSLEVYELMDDWIVDAVAQENNNVLKIINELIECVKSEKMNITEFEFKIERTSLYGILQQKTYTNTQEPLYLRNMHVPHDDLDSRRFQPDHLNQIFKEMKQNTGDRGSYDSLDQQSFKNIMMLAFRQGRVPLVWKYKNFEQIEIICAKFKDSPLPTISFGGEGPTQYQSKLNRSLGKGFDSERQWIQWKKIVTSFALLNTKVPSESQLSEYRKVLTDQAASDDFIEMDQFIETPAWFDKIEGTPDQALFNEWKKENDLLAADSEYDSDEDQKQDIGNRLDKNRLKSIKTLLFNTHRVKTGEDKLFISSFIDTLSEMTVGVSNITFSKILFD